MALLRQGPLGTPSGRIAATQFAACRGSVVVSQPGPHRLSHSTAALDARAQFAFYARAWSGPNMDQYRAAWIQFASQHPVRDRFGMQRYQSGYQLWLSFVPMMAYYGFDSYAPPMWDTSEFVGLSSIYIYSDGTMTVTSTGYYDTGYTREFIRFARFQEVNRRSRRQSWITLAPQTKYDDTTDYTAALAETGQAPVIGETWQFELRYWSPYKMPSPRALNLATCLS